MAADLAEQLGGVARAYDFAVHQHVAFVDENMVHYLPGVRYDEPCFVVGAAALYRAAARSVETVAPQRDARGLADERHVFEVYARLRLVEADEVGRLQDYLKHLRALHLSAGEPRVYLAVEELARVELLSRALDLLVGQRRAAERNKRAQRDAAYRRRPLERYADAEARALVYRRVRYVLPLEADRALRHMVAREAYHCVQQRRLARAVGPEQRMDLALADRERNAFQDLRAVYGHVQVLYLKQFFFRHYLSSTSNPREIREKFPTPRIEVYNLISFCGRLQRAQSRRAGKCVKPRAEKPEKRVKTAAILPEKCVKHRLVLPEKCVIIFVKGGRAG